MRWGGRSSSFVAELRAHGDQPPGISATRGAHRRACIDHRAIIVPDIAKRWMGLMDAQRLPPTAGSGFPAARALARRGGLKRGRAHAHRTLPGGRRPDRRSGRHDLCLAVVDGVEQERERRVRFTPESDLRREQEDVTVPEVRLDGGDAALQIGLAPAPAAVYRASPARTTPPPSRLSRRATA